MGRRPYKNTNLPPRMRARKQRSGRVYYYYEMAGRKEKALGSDYILALQEYARLEQSAQAVDPTFNDAADRYVVGKLPNKSARSQRDNLKELPYLREFFGDAPLDEIEPVHVNQFTEWRRQKAVEWLKERGRPVTAESGHVRANREKALFSHIFNYARSIGLTASPNPCAGTEALKESGRDVYVEDSMYRTVWEAADQPLRDAMDLAYLTGQRPADTVSLTEHDIVDGHIRVTQGKTGKKLRIAVEGELAAVIERIRERRKTYKIVSMHLVINQRGWPVSSRTVADWVRKIRLKTGIDPDSFQFRDLRAKAGTDKEDSQDITAAQNLLGHTSQRTTAIYVRNRLGKKVGPTK